MRVLTIVLAVVLSGCCVDVKEAEVMGYTMVERPDGLICVKEAHLCAKPCESSVWD
jgi:hypothetical protein